MPINCHVQSFCRIVLVPECYVIKLSCYVTDNSTFSLGNGDKALEQYKRLIYLPEEVAIGAYFHGRDIFLP